MTHAALAEVKGCSQKAGRAPADDRLGGELEQKLRSPTRYDTGPAIAILWATRGR